jgi:hypothetical protein
MLMLDRRLTTLLLFAILAKLLSLNQHLLSSHFQSGGLNNCNRTSPASRRRQRREKLWRQSVFDKIEIFLLGIGSISGVTLGLDTTLDKFLYRLFLLCSSHFFLLHRRTPWRPRKRCSQFWISKILTKVILLFVAMGAVLIHAVPIPPTSEIDLNPSPASDGFDHPDLTLDPSWCPELGAAQSQPDTQTRGWYTSILPDPRISDAEQFSTEFNEELDLIESPEILSPLHASRLADDSLINDDHEPASGSTNYGGDGDPQAIPRNITPIRPQTLRALVIDVNMTAGRDIFVAVTTESDFIEEPDSPESDDGGTRPEEDVESTWSSFPPLSTAWGNETDLDWNLGHFVPPARNREYHPTAESIVDVDILVDSPRSLPFLMTDRVQGASLTMGTTPIPRDEESAEEGLENREIVVIDALEGGILHDPTTGMMGQDAEGHEEEPSERQSILPPPHLPNAMAEEPLVETHPMAPNLADEVDEQNSVGSEEENFEPPGINPPLPAQGIPLPLEPTPLDQGPTNPTALAEDPDMVRYQTEFRPSVQTQFGVTLDPIGPRRPTWMTTTVEEANAEVERVRSIQERWNGPVGVREDLTIARPAGRSSPRTRACEEWPDSPPSLSDDEEFQKPRQVDIYTGPCPENHWELEYEDLKDEMIDDLCLRFTVGLTLNETTPRELGMNGNGPPLHQETIPPETEPFAFGPGSPAREGAAHE